MDGINKTYEFEGDKGVTAQVTVEETYTQSTNKSTVKVYVSLKNTKYYSSSHAYYLTGTIKAAGKTLQTMKSSTGTHSVMFSALDTYYGIAANSSSYTGSPWKTSVTHEDDGTKSITVSIDITGYRSDGGGSNGFKVSGSKTVALTTIPRESTIGATDANIGSTSAIAITKKSTDYTHSIKYEFGEISGYVTESGGTSSTEKKFSAASIAFSVPTTFYDQIPSARRGVCTLTCKTYSGSTQIGTDKTCSFVAYANSLLCSPTVSGKVEDSNSDAIALTGDKTKLIKYVSNAKCTITATGKNGATIVTKTIGGSTVTGTTKTITKFSESSVEFTATDTRGYKTSKTVNVSLVDYVPLTCVATGKRTDIAAGDAKITIKGKYFNGSFGSTSNSLTVRYRKGSGSWVSLTPTKSGSSYSASVSLTGLEYTDVYTFTVEVADKVSTITKEVKIDKGVPVFDWGEKDFSFHVPVLHDGGMKPVFLSENRIENEQQLKDALEVVYEKMKDSEVMLVKFQGYPSSTNYNFYGILSRSSSSYGSLFVQSAYNNGTIYTLTRSGGAWQTLKTMEDHVKRGLNPYNLLDNGDFRNPVNQRGVSETAAPDHGYFMDRWKIYGENSTFDLSTDAGCLRIRNTGPATCGIYQRVEASKLTVGNTYTLAAKVKVAYSNAESGVCYLSYSNAASAAGENIVKSAEVAYTGEYTITTLSFTLTESTDGVYNFRLRTTGVGGDFYVDWMALYEGEYTADTLPVYQPKGYAAEYAECLRYFYRVYDYTAWVGYKSTTAYAFIQVASPMRITPTVTAQSFSLRGTLDAETKDVFIEPNQVHAGHGNTYRLRFSETSLTAQQPLVCVTYKLELSADL